MRELSDRQLHFPEPKSVASLPVASLCIQAGFFLFVCLLPLCYLLYSQGTICCFLLITKQGNSGNYRHTDRLCRVQKANFMSGSDL